MRVDERRDLENRMIAEGRLPPGQSATLKFPVLHYGPVPRTDLSTWDLRVFGLVNEEKSWNWQEFTALPTKTISTDIHCVTRWSKFDTLWEGVPFRDIVDMVGVKPEAKFVIAHCEYGYTTNMPLDAMLDDDVMLAYNSMASRLNPITATRCERWFPSATSGRAPNGCAASNLQRMIASASGSRLAITMTPTH